MSEEIQKKQKRKIKGTVVSDKMNKTVVVQVTTLVKHPMYGKYYRKYKKFKAHDEKEEAHIGDRVQIIECRPLSKTKSFRLYKVLDRAKKIETNAKVA